MIDTIDNITEMVKENISYDILKIMIDAISSTSQTVRVSGQAEEQSIVKSQFFKLHYDHISYVCLCLSQNTTK